jgi:hypothetical protein
LEGIAQTYLRKGMKLCIDDLDLKKRLLIRVDFNVLDEHGKIMIMRARALPRSLIGMARRLF